ncbi:uncharacterized protein [Anabrus simplex]|uniref:uncharacterized protein n=1 Tax=Anabrus simplex TaxID=316456 RepID=UPI0034DD77DA
MACNSKALYSTAVASLGFVCFAVGATAVGLPLWGYFDSPDIGGFGDRGYFGPWQLCQERQFNRVVCGPTASRFRPVPAVWYAGLVATIGVAMLGVFCVLSVLQLAMVMSRERMVLSYSSVVITKLALGLLAALLSCVAAGLFAFQTDREDNYRVSRGESFYIQITSIALNFLLFVMALYDMLFSRRMDGDPTKTSRDPRGEDATTINNPGFRERDRHPNVSTIAVTDGSGQPYPVPINGSVGSVTTTASSNGSARSPLRSSLKKTRTRPDGMGIQNPGFSGQSPTLSRNGSVKKVKFETYSTAV